LSDRYVDFSTEITWKERFYWST